MSQGGKIITSDAGSQYRCGRVGRGIQPQSTLQVPRSHAQKAYKRSFPHFLTRVHGPADRRTDGPMDGQSLL